MAEREPTRRKRPDVNPRTPAQLQDDLLKRPKKNMDLLHRAREMGKKIWSLDKLQRMMELLLETDPHVSVALAYGSRRPSVQAAQAQTRAAEETSLAQLLHNERVHGPSDRDRSVVSQDLHYFKGPYIYVYDYEEKQKPIMVKEYQKVANKADGDWPQFRSAAVGRCPFVEDYDAAESRMPRARPAEQARKPAVETKPVLRPPKAGPPKPVTGKRTLSEIQSSHNNRGSSASATATADSINAAKPAAAGRGLDLRPNAFTSRAAAGRLFAGEPVASGVQPSNVTSAVRSQMISSTAANPGVITGLSKEVHGLQRKVLQRNSTATSGGDPSSRRNAENSFKNESSSKRSITLGRTSSRKIELIDEKAGAGKDGDDSKPATKAEKHAPQKMKRRDPKPGYCENCNEKFEDFEDVSYRRRCV